MAAEEILQIDQQAHVAIKGSAFKFHEEIDVAIGPGLVAAHRAKERQCANGEAIDDLVPVGGDQGDDVGSADARIIPSRVSGEKARTSSQPKAQASHGWLGGSHSMSRADASAPRREAPPPRKNRLGSMTTRIDRVPVRDRRARRHRTSTRVVIYKSHTRGAVQRVSTPILEPRRIRKCPLL